MASKLVPHSLCAHNSNEGDFGYGCTADTGCCGKARWNTMRQGEIWINGLFCEQEVYMTNGNYEGIGSQGDRESWTNAHSDVDWISKEIAFQEFICSETPTNRSDLHTGKTDFIREEHDLDILSTLTAVAALFGEWCAVEAELSDPVAKEGIENCSKMKKDKRGELAVIENIKSEASKTTYTSNAASTHHGLLQTSWSNGNHMWNGYQKEHSENEQGLCHAFIDHGFIGGTFKGGLESMWLPDMVARRQSHEDAGTCQGYSMTDVGLMSRSEQEAQMYLAQYDWERPMRETACNENRAGGTSFSLSDEEKRVHKELLNRMTFENEHGVYLEQKPAALSGSFLSRSNSPCIPGREDHESENELFMENGSSKSNVLSCNEDLNKSGFMPAEALFYALSYMSLQDILSMERVCKSLRDWIKNDVLLWQRLHVEAPLNKKFTDEALLQLASRSKGQLQCLSLVDCLRITEGAVEQVVLSNPRLSKLCLPGCSRISAEAVIRMVKTHTDCGVPGMPGLKQLRIRNIYGLTREHLDSLLMMLDAGEQTHSGALKPQFYHNGHYSFSCDDQRPIDVEACPKCNNVRLVYDCTRERCQQRQGSKLQECRACVLCIVRCEECGRCINDNDYEETFCLDLLCSSCWLRLPKCSECNRPGCGRHADHFIRTPETTFLCSDCCGSSSGASGPEFHVYA